MKRSLCQMIAVICILSVGFLTAAPFVQTADADDFTATLYYVHAYYCHECGTMLWYDVVGETTLIVSHAPGAPHLDIDYYDVVKSFTVENACILCYWYDLHTSS